MNASEGVNCHLAHFSVLHQVRGWWSASRSSRVNLGADPAVSTVQEAGWAQELVWTLWRTEKPLLYAGNRTTVPWSWSPSMLYRLCYPVSDLGVEIAVSLK